MQPEPSSSSSSSSPSTSTTPLPSLGGAIEDGEGGKGLSAREKRMKVREEKSQKISSIKKGKGRGKSKELALPPSTAAATGEGDLVGTSEEKKGEEEEGPLCIVYHSWEHYSSLRNLKGPHTGPPRLRIVRFSLSYNLSLLLTWALMRMFESLGLG